MINGSVIHPRNGMRVSWRLAQPIADLVEQGKRLGLTNLGTIGNRSHLLRSGGHTPYRRGSKRGIVWAKDTKVPTDFRVWLIKACKKVSYDTRWIKFWNCDYRQYDNRGNYLGPSSDGHLHIEVADGYERYRTTLFDDYVNRNKRKVVKPVSSIENQIKEMILDGDSPTGTDTVEGGKSRIVLIREIQYNRDEIKRVSNELDEVNAKLDEVIRLIKAGQL